MTAAEIRPSSPQPDNLEIAVGILTFRPRFSDFVWGDRRTGDFVSALGYRIYIGLHEDFWYLIDGRGRRSGPFRDLLDAANRAETFALKRIERGLSPAEWRELTPAKAA